MPREATAGRANLHEDRSGSREHELDHLPGEQRVPTSAGFAVVLTPTRLWGDVRVVVSNSRTNSQAQIGAGDLKQKCPSSDGVKLVSHNDTRQDAKVS